MQHNDEERVDPIDVARPVAQPPKRSTARTQPQEDEEWSAAIRKAQALHSVDELLTGIRDVDWRVRVESIPRLIARWGRDPRVLPALIELATSDDAWQVRDSVIFLLCEFDDPRVAPILRLAVSDPQPEVRWSAQQGLFQLGLADPPESYPDDDCGYADDGE